MKGRKEVDTSLRELNPHGTFQLPVETYTDNCVIFHSLYNHWHQEMELLRIEKGQGRLRLNRETLPIEKGDILLVNPGVIHGISTDLKDILYYKSIVFRLEFLSGPAGDLWQEEVLTPLLENRVQAACRVRPKDAGYEEISRLFGGIHDCHSQKRPYYYVRLKALFYALFHALLAENYIVPAAREGHRNLEAIKSVLDYIHGHYPEALTAQGLAERSNFCPTYFMKLFREYTGKTLIDYLNGFRLEKARALLAHTDASVTEIATQVGFNTTSYFIRRFQEAYGVTPMQFRRNLP